MDKLQLLVGACVLLGAGCSPSDYAKDDGPDPGAVASCHRGAGSSPGPTPAL
jgi:hypothetical protein